MNRRERDSWIAKGYKDPKKSYMNHLCSAKARGIDFKLTFDEWWSYWKPHYENRGRQSGNLCMCRNSDSGAYEVGNVRIDTVESNAAERNQLQKEVQIKSGRIPASQRAAVSRDGDNWTKRRGFWGLGYFKLLELYQEKPELFE